MASTNVQRTIKFNTVQLKRNQGKINKSRTIFSRCAPKKICINPDDNVQVGTQIEAELSDEIIGTTVVLPTIQTLGLKLKNGDSIEDTQTLTFLLLNQNFLRRFTFKRNGLIASLIILNGA